jgi:alpha-beta hydrolase superfamily lysophospholipase
LYPLAQSKSAVTLARLMASLDPLGDAAPIVTEGLMHSTAEQDINRADPRIYPTSIRNKTAYELLQLTPLCLGADGIAKFPPAMHIAFHHGADDNLTLPSSSQVAFDACPCISKTLAFHNGAKHEILHEAPEVSNAILASMCDFFDSSLAAGGAGDGGGISNPVASSPLTIAN